MTEKKRGLVIFVAVIVSLLLLAPISGSAQAREGGGTINDIYFGMFRYMVLRSELKEPDYTFTRTWRPKRVVLTALGLGGIWAGVAAGLRKRRVVP